MLRILHLTFLKRLASTLMMDTQYLSTISITLLVSGLIIQISVAEIFLIFQTQGNSNSIEVKSMHLRNIDSMKIPDYITRADSLRVQFPKNLT